MRLRKTYITEDKTISDSGTEIFDLDFTDPVVALELGFYGKRYDHTDTNEPYLLNDIDKIEIVDGSDVIYNLTGIQAATVELYHSGKKPFEAITLNKYSTNRTQLKILFGRSIYDSEFALDCTRFTNPQLKITYSFTEGSTGNWADNQQKVTVGALIAEGGSKPRGFFMNKEIYSWSKSTSGDETIDLPRDYPYRFIVVQSDGVTTPIYNEFSDIKVSCNYDEFVPIDETTEDTAWSNLQKYGYIYQQTESIGDGSDTDIKAYYPLAWNWGAWSQSWNYGQSAVVKRPYSGYITVAQAQCPNSADTQFNINALENAQRAIITGYGWEYYDSEVVLFGDIEDETNWFDPKPWKSVRFILTQGGSSSTTSTVVLQQVRTY